MNWWTSRRNQLIAAQAVVVGLLCAAVYIGLLRPGSTGSLSGVTAPGGYHGTHTSQAPRGNPPNGPQPGGGNGGAHPGGGGAARAGGGPARGGARAGGGGAPPLGGQGNPSLPSGNQYASAVSALAAKVGPTAAKQP